MPLDRLHASGRALSVPQSELGSAKLQSLAASLLRHVQAAALVPPDRVPGRHKPGGYVLALSSS